MWLLTLASEEKEQVFYVTQRKSEFSVGRSKADLILANDSSISRNHCVICIGSRDNCPFPIKTRTGLWVKDLKSKYGTFIQEGQSWVKLVPDQNTHLPHGSFVRFGIVTNIWSVEYKPLIICPSNVSDEVSEALKEKVAPLDGLLIAQFDPRCALVVTPSIALSLKVLLALVHGVPIVSPAYIDEVAEAVNESLKWPSPSNFLPPLAESTVRVADANFDCTQTRKTLFKGLTFYVGTIDQLESLKLVIEGAGGKLSMFEGDNPERLLKDGALLLESSQSRATMSQRTQSQTQDSQWNDNIKGFLIKNGRRTIPEREIPLAIVYNSVSKLCNATCLDFNPRITSSATLTSALNSAVIEAHTEPQTNLRSTGSGIINSSLSPDKDKSPIAARPALRSSAVPEVNFKVPSIDLPATGSTSTSAVVSTHKSCDGSVPSTANPFISAKPSSCKRSGSIDIFEEEMPPKRVQSGQHFADNKVVSAFKTGSGSSKSKDKLSSFWDSGGNNEKKSTATTHQSASQSNKSNPFGAGLITSTPIPAQKRPLHDSEEVSFVKPKKSKQNIIPSPVVPVTVARPDLIPRVQKKEVTIEKSLADADEFGFIDMSYKKEKEPEPDGLGTTVIMLSLVTLAHRQMHTTAPENDPSKGLKNVKVFKKQSVKGLNHRVEVESLQAQVIDEAWAATDP